MNLSKVTMTGADDSINPEKLFELSAKFPYAEWAILLSRNSRGGNRFPSLKWMNRLAALDNDFFDFEMQYSGHLCGAYVREFLMGNTDFVKEIGDIWDLFQRIQINTHGIKHEYDKVKLLNALAQYPEKEFIFQYDNANKEILDYVVANSEVNVSTLFDLSHGAGVLPEEWPLPIEGIKCGYAGGLSPENVSDQIKLIESKIGDAEIWIDMETKVRSNNDTLFDLTKVESVFETCKAHVEYV
jgi:hypothetical protein